MCVCDLEILRHRGLKARARCHKVKVSLRPFDRGERRARSACTVLVKTGIKLVVHIVAKVFTKYIHACRHRNIYYNPNYYKFINFWHMLSDMATE